MASPPGCGRVQDLQRSPKSLQQNETIDSTAINSLAICGNEAGSGSGVIATSNGCNIRSNAASFATAVVKVDSTAVTNVNYKNVSNSVNEISSNMINLQIGQEGGRGPSATCAMQLKDDIPRKPRGLFIRSLKSMPVEVHNHILSYLVPCGLMVEPCSPLVVSANRPLDYTFFNNHLFNALSDTLYGTDPDEILYPFSPFPTGTLRVYQVSWFNLSYTLDEAQSQEYPYSTFASCRLYRALGLTSLYATNEVLFRNADCLVRFHRNLCPSLAKSLRNVRVDIKLRFVYLGSDLDSGTRPLLDVLRASSLLRNCSRLETIHVTLHLDCCKEQRRIGSILKTFANNSLSTQPSFPCHATITVTTVDCLHCKTPAPQVPRLLDLENESYQPVESHQFWEWKLLPKTSVFQTKRYHVRSDSRIELVSLRDIIDKFRVDAKEDRAGATRRLLEQGKEFQQMKCTNAPTCHNTCESIPADLTRSRPFWCAKCELVFHCRHCGIVSDEHASMCIPKPESQCSRN